MSGRAFGLLGMAGLLAAAPGHAQTLADPNRGMVPPVLACEAAIAHAQSRYALPPGLLLAIGLVESGRTDPASGRVRPWPWAVQAGSRSLYFETRTEAVAWVQDARAGDTASVDTGCLQVNLMYHPKAFATVDEAFDPEGNVDYAARFLVRLHAETNDWPKAIGFYHSRTPALALAYQQQVQVTMGHPAGGTPQPPSLPQPLSLAAQLAHAWAATGPPPNKPATAGPGGWSSLLKLPSGPFARGGAAPPARHLAATEASAF